MVKDVTTNIIVGLAFLIAGCIMIWIPNAILSLILTTSIILLFVNGAVLLYRFIKTKNKGDLLFFVLSILFATFLLNHNYFPHWIIRVSFGAYCLLSSLVSFIQLVINYMNEIPGNFFYVLLAVVYAGLGISLLAMTSQSMDFLMRIFGAYFIVLSIRYFNDAINGINPLVKYEWKRKIRITLPAIVCALIPDWVLSSINQSLRSGKPYQMEKKNSEEETDLKVMVHVGPYGFQKVGHISFAYKGVVYSYGNYDVDSFRFNQTIGDGVFFTVPFEYYIPNAMSAEKNSIFEYGVRIEEDQRPLIEQAIEKIVNNGYRWYCRLEREDGYDRFDEYKEDYPSRLHYKTGAKFYKVKRGKFKTYWALGDNCALFTDLILGKLGADVLSMRGIISPGTYLEYLQNEYLKKNSPIVSLKIHSIEADGRNV